MEKAKIVRPPGLAVFAIVVLGVALAWWLYADRLVERGVETTGESLVGARVELEGADVRPTEGSIRLTGLQVANPDAPMTNLMEAEEITLDLLLGPLLEKKVVVQELVVSGVRFNTPRETSGALDNPDPESGALWREVEGWVDRVEVPSLRLEALTGVVRTEALSPDSLATVRNARAVVARADSMREAWEARLSQLDPRPRMDSVAAVVSRLEGFQPSPFNALQVPGLVRDGQQALESVTSLRVEVGALGETVSAGMATLDAGQGTIAELRAQDLAYARGLLDIPSLEASTISPALFGNTALVWLKPVLYWARAAERFLPPGLDPRNRPGPRRARAAGTTVEFPREASYPGFLVQRGDVDLELGGTGAAAGVYTAEVRGLTSAPALLGQPMELSVAREEGQLGPRGLSLSAVLDHTTPEPRDAVELEVDGLTLPEIGLGGFGGTLALGEGVNGFTFSRVGDEIDAELRWTSRDVRWSDSGQTPDPAPIGTREWVRQLVWRTLTGIREVELVMGLDGDISSPSLSVSSNLGGAVAASLQRELGEQVAEAEQRVREELDRHIRPAVQDARGSIDALRSDVGSRVAAQRQEVEDLENRLRARVDELVGRLPAGSPGTKP